jgi:hypothetical protein
MKSSIDISNLVKVENSISTQTNKSQDKSIQFPCALYKKDNMFYYLLFREVERADTCIFKMRLKSEDTESALKEYNSILSRTDSLYLLDKVKLTVEETDIFKKSKEFFYKFKSNILNSKHDENTNS